MAISPNAWFSLGRHGLGLHFEAARGRVGEVLVLKRGARGKAWEVTLDGRVMERFSVLEEAVEAVDFELERRGRLTAASARHEAAWRRAPSQEGAVSIGEAMQRATFTRVARGGSAKPGS